jgi:plasmid replication initiation protein
MAKRRYEHNGNWLEVTPSFRGLATIYDKDILIFCISQLVTRRKRGEPVSPRIRIGAADVLAFCNRGTSGPDYEALSDALERLAGTRIITNIRTGDEEEKSNFGLINSSTMRRKHGPTGRLLWVEVELSQWVMKAVVSNEVLTLHRDYFRLGRPIERRIYELARKHCGRQPQWTISLAILHKKSGSQGPEAKFRLITRQIAKTQHLPDYTISYDAESDQVTFRPREAWWEKNGGAGLLPDAEDIPPLTPRVYEDAKAAAPGYDVYALEEDWRQWWKDSGRPKLENPAAAFVGFCRVRHERSPVVRSASIKRAK